jgi:hypothetical protein
LATKAPLLEEITQFEAQLQTIKAQLQQTPHHLQWDQLSEEDQFHRLAPTRRRLLDTLCMIAYRAETAMVPWLLNDAELVYPGTDLTLRYELLADSSAEP